MERSKDQIWGFVTEVHDGDTLTLKVTSQRRSNGYNYKDNERVRLQGINAPELGRPGGEAAKRRLAPLLNQRVKCTIHGRDKYGRIVSDVVRAPSDRARR